MKRPVPGRNRDGTQTNSPRQSVGGCCYVEAMPKWVHRLSDVDTEKHTATCAECGPVQLRKKAMKTDLGYRWACPTAVRKSKRSPADKTRDRGRRPHGLTATEAKLEREGKVCAICGYAERMAVDHDHATGTRRDVLCQRCNTGLGCFQDDPERMEAAAAYVRRWCGAVARPEPML